MSGSSLALDTNQVIHVLNDVPAVVVWLDSFGQLYVPVAALGELLYGALNSAKPAQNYGNLARFLKRCTVLDTNSETARIYAELRADLKKIGRPIPENDLWIAASCLQHRMPLASDDHHFSVISGLQVVKAP